MTKREYTVSAITSTVMYTCPDCGAHVSDITAHDKFHEKIGELSQRSTMGLH